MVWFWFRTLVSKSFNSSNLDFLAIALEKLKAVIHLRRPKMYCLKPGCRQEVDQDLPVALGLTDGRSPEAFRLEGTGA